MYIRCWGSRGQIPVSGVEYNKYGGDTNITNGLACSLQEIIKALNDVVQKETGKDLM